MATLLLMIASASASGASLVTFSSPPGSTVVAVSEADQQVIREAIDETLADLSELTGRRARPVAVKVFRTREEFVTDTQLPPDYGAVTRDGVILMQPIAMLGRNQGLCRILPHEAVHHFFFRIGRRWPRNFHEALAHVLSGAPAAESPRAAELARRERTGAEEVEFESHLAWMLEVRIRPVGLKEFIRRLLRGEVEMEPFRRGEQDALTPPSPLRPFDWFSSRCSVTAQGRQGRLPPPRAGDRSGARGSEQ